MTREGEKERERKEDREKKRNGKEGVDVASR
jgi:hypothetical protein